MLRALLFSLLCLQTLVWGGVRDIYSVGTQDDRATLWITNSDSEKTQTIILGLPNESSVASCVTSSGDKLYITGSQGTQANQIAILWITNLKGQLLQAIPIANKQSSASSITCGARKLYIAGLQYFGINFVATQWIVNLDGIVEKMVALGSPGDSSFTRSIALYKNNIFIVGAQNQGLNPMATLWILDHDGSILKTVEFGIPSKDLAGGFITCLNNALFISGFQQNNIYPQATLWIKNLDGSSISSAQLDNSNEPSAGDSIAFLNNNIYIAGTAFPTSLPQYGALWITNNQADYLNTILVSEKADDSAAGSALTIGNQLIAAGEENNIATLWFLNFNGSIKKKITLGGPFSSALYIYFSGGGSNTLENAFKTFSPMKYQRGY